VSSPNGKPAALLSTAGSVLFLAAGTSSPSDGLRFHEMLPVSGVTYRNVSGETEKRFILSSLGSGAALFDYDEDGDLDLYLVNGSTLDGTRVLPGQANHLYRNEGAWSFRDVTDRAGVGDTGWGQGAAVGDFDNDGFGDLYVTNIGPNVLFRNQGDGTFRRVTEEAGVGHDGWGTSAAFFDADDDGDLDLYVANYVDSEPASLPLPGSGPTCRWLEHDVFCGPKGLVAAVDVFYRNEGNGLFSETSGEAGFLAPSAGYGLGVVAGDYDGDGDPDLYVANDSVPNFLYRNDGAGRFREVGLVSGAAYNASGLAEAGMGVDLADLDADGLLDIFVTNFSSETNTFYSNRGGGTVVDATSESRLEMASLAWLGWATRFVDWDNDGMEDLFVANGHVFPQMEGDYRQRNQIFLNQGDGQFSEATFSPGDAMETVASSRGGAFGDLDNDGDTDAVIINIDDAPSLLRNDTAGQGRWLGLRMIGRGANRDAVGTRVTVTAGTLRQIKEVHPSGSFLSSNDPRLYFGLGAAQHVQSIHITWPNGAEQSLGPTASDQLLVVVESGETASFPLE